MCSTSCRMDCCDDRSANRRSTALFLLFVVISLLASSPLARSRQTMTTVAPICASSSAVAFPIPELAPVTMQIFPCILLFTIGMMRSFHAFLSSSLLSQLPDPLDVNFGNSLVEFSQLSWRHNDCLLRSKRTQFSHQKQGV